MRRTQEMAGYFFSFTTEDGVRRDVELAVDPDERQGELEMMTRGGRPIECDGLQRAVDHTAETVRLVVPRACLENPRWVRAGAGTYRVASAYEKGDMVVDDAHRNGSIGRAQPAYGERVRRG